MLYEMVSGQPPFTAANSASLMSAILTEDPQPLARYARDTPPELERIVSKAMRKDRDSRYQTAKDLLIDMRTLQDDVRTGAARARSASSSTSAATISGSHAQAAVSTAPAHAETVAAARPTHLSLRTPLIAIALLAVAGAGVWFYRHRTNVAWATAQVPRIEALAQSRGLLPGLRPGASGAKVSAVRSDDHEVDANPRRHSVGDDVAGECAGVSEALRAGRIGEYAGAAIDRRHADSGAADRAR